MTRGQRVLLWVVAAFGIGIGLLLFPDRVAGRRELVYDPTSIILLLGGILAAYKALSR